MDELLNNPIFATHAIAATGAVVLGTAVTYPLDTIKTLIQVGSHSSKALTATQVVDRIRVLSGYAGLYSGFGWSALGRIGGLGARFGVYEVLTAFYKDGREDNYVHVSEALLAGIASGALESITSSPFDLLKLRAQVTSATRLQSATSTMNTTAPSINSRLLRSFVLDNKVLEHAVGLLSTLTSKHENIASALKNYPWMITGSGKPPAVSDVRHPLDVIRLEGWAALWRGLRAGVVRDSIFGGTFFATWQFLHLAMLDWKAVGMNPPPKSDEEIGPISPVAISLAAGVSGSVAAAAAHGFDTARSRSQCSVVPKYITMERRFLKWKWPGNKFERYTGIHPTDRNLLSRGIWLRMARSGISSFMIIGTYFFAVNRLSAN